MFGSITPSTFTNKNKSVTLNTVLAYIMCAIKTLDKDPLVTLLHTSGFTDKEFKEAILILWKVADDVATLGPEPTIDKHSTRNKCCRIVVEGLIKLDRVFNVPNFVFSPPCIERLMKPDFFSSRCSLQPRALSIWRRITH